LVNKSIRMADAKFVPLCEEISGNIGRLVVDSTYNKAGTSEYPIDLVVLDLANSIDLNDDTEDNGAEAATTNFW
jgi:hypothetical protein